MTKDKQVYVCGFLCDVDNYVVFIRKNQPKWQQGLLNGVGGKVEPDDFTIISAMEREWREETATNTQYDWEIFAEQRGVFDNYVVYFLKAKCDVLPEMPHVNDVGEGIAIYKWYEAILDDDIVENLSWLLPLAFRDETKLYVTAQEL